MVNAKDIRIVFMGTPDFAVGSLQALVEGGYNVVAVVTMPDKPAGRGLKLQESAVKKYAVEVGLPVLQPEKLKSPEFIEQMQMLRPDLGIVVAFRMLPEVIWAMPPMGTFNLHASLLPQYRGAAPINWAIINGETETGVTTFFLNHKIDEGEIIDRRVVNIQPDDNAGTIHDKLMEVGSVLVTETVDALAAESVKPMSQPKSIELKDAPKIFKDTCHIDFSRSGVEIVNLIRGLSPYPAAWANLLPESGETLATKIFSAAFEPASFVEPKAIGSIISDGKNYIKVICTDGYLNVNELQIAGKKRMTAQELLRGFKGIDTYRLA